MSQTESGTMTAHQFSSINIAGHARVIVGSAHGPDHGFANEQSSLSQWPTLFSARLRDLCRTTNDNIYIGSILSLATFIVKDLYNLKVLIHESVSDESTDWWSRDVTVRQTIFRSCLQNMLSTCTERAKAREMLQRECHAMWTDSTFLKNAGEKFGHHETSIRHVLELIDRDVGAVGSRLQNLRASEDPRTLARMNQHEDLDHQLTSLQNHIHDFRDLVQQDFAAQRQTPSMEAPSRVKEKVGEFRSVQKAASDLYQSFLLACEQHQQHRVWLRIEANEFQAQKIKFNLVFDRTVTDDENTDAQEKARLSLVIRSTLNTSLLPHSNHLTTLSEYICTIESNDGQVLQQGRTHSDRTRKRKRRRLDTTQGSTDRQNPRPEIHNFCEKGDMCAHISRSSLELCREELLLGILRSVGSSQHAIYALNGAALEQNCRLEDKLQYVTQVLSSTNEDIALLRHAKIRLAKQLSITVLQYNATPWLQQSWDSNHVLIEKEDPQHSDDESLGPIADLEDHRKMSYLDVTIQKLPGVETNNLLDTPRTMIRNVTLFRLGVMLIELAYGRSFPSMLIPEDVFVHTHASLSKENTDYCAADRLQKGVARKLGPVYARLVRQCIDCDFGHGQDLTKTELQESFYEHVIDKLEVLEAKFKDLGI